MLSKKAIMEDLPKVVFKDRRYIPKRERGIYFLLENEEIIYIGASDCIYQRLTNSLTRDHPVGKYSDMLVLQSLGFSSFTEINRQEFLAYKNECKYYWNVFKETVVVSWWLLPSVSRSDLIKFEGILIEQYQPRINCKHITRAKKCV